MPDYIHSFSKFETKMYQSFRERQISILCQNSNT